MNRRPRTIIIRRGNGFTHGLGFGVGCMAVVMVVVILFFAVLGFFYARV